jgi:hypothetical protein
VRSVLFTVTVATVRETVTPPLTASDCTLKAGEQLKMLGLQARMIVPLAGEGFVVPIP